VRTAVMKSVSNYLSLRRDQLPRRNSAFSSVFIGAEQGSVERQRAASTATQAPIVDQKPKAWRRCWLKMATNDTKNQDSIDLEVDSSNPLPE